MAPRATTDLYVANQRRTRELLRRLRRSWTLTVDGDWDAQWSEMRTGAVQLVASAQLGAARDGAAAVPAALKQSGVKAKPEGRVNPVMFAGVASDGRSLVTLLDQTLTTARMAGSSAAGVRDAWQFLTVAGQMQTADAARTASAAAIASTPGVGWYRMVNPPCCPYCAVLDGKWYEWNQGFQRHPGCDCVHIPASEYGSPGDMPSTIDVSQIKDLTKGERAAIENGADLNQVVNARRESGRYNRDADRMFTTEGTTRRGVAYRAIRQNHGAFAEARAAGDRYTRTTVRRLTPDGILRVATDRDDAIRLLTTYGYVL